MIVPVKIERVLRLRGVFYEGYMPTNVYAHVTVPLPDKHATIQYALPSFTQQHGFYRFMNIDPETRTMESVGAAFGTYEKDRNRIIQEIGIPTIYLPELKEVKQVLGIAGISVEEEWLPVGSNPAPLSELLR